MWSISRSILLATLSFLLGFSTFGVVAAYGTPAQAFNPPVVMKTANWAGYGIQAPNAGVTAIRTSFMQPALNCKPTAIPPPHYVDFVAGLNGKPLSNAFEFVGTQGICPAGS